MIGVTVIEFISEELQNSIFASILRSIIPFNFTIIGVPFLLILYLGILKSQLVSI